MKRKELIERYIGFFKGKNHKEIPNSSLIPENDPTVLFTTAGMHPLVPYLLGQKHPLGKRLVNVQRCLRTVDIDEVGDKTHSTFFEMFGNWSLGDYWKKEAIKYSFEFLTGLGFKKEKLAVTIFKGDRKIGVSEDKESIEIWRSLGITNERIAHLGKEDNWWGPAGETGPCGPCTEIFYWAAKEKIPEKYDPANKKWIEIGNNVFMEYNKLKIDTILVDAINCLIDKERGLNEELANFLRQTGKKIVVVTNASEKEIKSFLKDYNFDVFTLNKNPEKTNLDYFKQLLNKHNFNTEKIIYFDHKEENLESAKKAGITNIKLYEDNEQIKKWIEKNSFKYEKLPQKNVDFGGGLDRQLTILNNLDDVFSAEIFLPIIKKIEKISGKKYDEGEEIRKSMRIMADHVKAAVFIIGDGVISGNVEQGYVLRRLIRRAVRYGRKLGMKNFIKAIAESVFEIYDDYEHLQKEKDSILYELEKEEKKFLETLEKGIKIFEKISVNKEISGKEAFLLYQSYGFPFEMTLELANEKNIKVNKNNFEDEFKKHQELSRKATIGKFKSGLADSSEQTIKLHTATHLLNESLRKILGEEIKQRGSNINPERLRFDFSFSRKLSNEEVKKVEKLVNNKIDEGLKVIKEEMPLKMALDSGAQAEFDHKYPDKVFVYTVIDNNESRGWFSREICTGPHVNNTIEIGGIKIIKEEAVSAGIRRIKAIINK